ncbi:hypothetical protein [Roseovarius azorensis]|nr:hypothetical protein [Roseovarius azorensis]
MNTIRVILLGGLIVTGVVVYLDRDNDLSSGPEAVTSLLPSPVSVTVLSGGTS